MREEPLSGGFVNEVVRIGRTVRRPPPERAAFVRELLMLFAHHGWPGAPRFHGLDGHGREILGHLDGEVAAARTDAGLARLAELVREFHDLTAGSRLAGDEEVVCHNDLSPTNTVYADGLPFAFIDWDLAAPGRRVQDLAHACWQYLDLGPSVTDPAEAARRIRLLCDAYGAAGADRRDLLDTVLWWQDRCARGIDAGAATGDPAMIRLREAGVPDAVRKAHAWTATHRDTLRGGL